MNRESWQTEAVKTVRTMQLAIGGIVFGAVLMLAIVLAIGPIKKPPAALLPVPLYRIVFILAAAGLVARFLYMRKLAAKVRREILNGTYTPLDFRERLRLRYSPPAPQPDPDRDAKYLLAGYRYWTTCSAAIIEGWSFLAIITYLIEGNPWSIALAVFAMLGVAAHYPTPSRLLRWLEEELEEVKQEKLLMNPHSGR